MRLYTPWKRMARSSLRHYEVVVVIHAAKRLKAIGGYGEISKFQLRSLKFRKIFTADLGEW